MKEVDILINLDKILGQSKLLENKTFDLILIDGGHQYETAIQDLNNCKNFATKETIIIIDDIVYNESQIKPWTIGPTKAWKESIKNKKIEEIRHYFIKNGRGLSIGKYIT
jgi:predicted O-methyltransferase YrrM